MLILLLHSKLLLLHSNMGHVRGKLMPGLTSRYLLALAGARASPRLAGGGGRRGKGKDWRWRAGPCPPPLVPCAATPFFLPLRAARPTPWAGEQESQVECCIARVKSLAGRMLDTQQLLLETFLERKKAGVFGGAGSCVCVCVRERGLGGSIGLCSFVLSWRR